MIIKEAIILAGGLGTRLKSVLPDLPKCLAPVTGKPFLSFVIEHYLNEGVEKFIFSLGYQHELIEAFLKKDFPNLHARCIIEQTPLGTGGAIRLACTQTTEETVLVLNGDTLFKINNSRLSYCHYFNKATCTLSLKPMNNFDRYGVVEIELDESVKSFREKKFYKTGLINGGVYALNPASFLKAGLPEKFSFEKDYLELQAGTYPPKLYASIQEQYFIDIGVPEDYERAAKELLKIKPPYPPLI